MFRLKGPRKVKKSSYFLIQEFRECDDTMPIAAPRSQHRFAGVVEEEESVSAYNTRPLQRGGETGVSNLTPGMAIAMQWGMPALSLIIGGRTPRASHVRRMILLGWFVIADADLDRVVGVGSYRRFVGAEGVGAGPVDSPRSPLPPQIVPTVTKEKDDKIDTQVPISHSQPRVVRQCAIVLDKAEPLMFSPLHWLD
ncbi:hypothetical protein NHQ30_011329 [Ciborinia camelliae]|nr:hypothetical protein NHQ30_011329 [Ciborinia camelliae]